MRTRSNARAETPRAIATLLLLAACLVLGGRAAAPAASIDRSTAADGSARVVGGSVEVSEVAGVIAAPSLHALRILENRIVPVWALAGLAVSIAAFDLCRRRRAGHTSAARHAFLRGRVASRAPPLASIA